MVSKSLIFFASIAAASALAIGPTPDMVHTATVCSGSLSPRNGCVDILIDSDQCHNLIGGLFFLNDEISNALVPPGFVCTFFDAFGCISNTNTDVVLQGGTWDFSHVPGIAGTVNFNDRASSLTCSFI
ncbi:hypothetical protein C8J57DRAFT_1259117 [Mycena rebaudengoi]|nr:hypothetical protein C8J57DRAFT_1259117 [Mycena rebaudengoi]